MQEFAEYQEQEKVIKKMKESIKRLEEFGRIGGNEKFFKRAASMRRALSAWSGSSDPCWNEDRLSLT